MQFKVLALITVALAAPSPQRPASCPLPCEKGLGYLNNVRRQEEWLKISPNQCAQNFIDLYKAHCGSVRAETSACAGNDYKAIVESKVEYWKHSLDLFRVTGKGNEGLSKQRLRECEMYLDSKNKVAATSSY